MNSSLVTGLYVSADAVSESPNYARKLVEECGVNLFVLRTGFNPGQACPQLDDTINNLTRLGARFMFLVGAWWGAGIENDPLTMKPVHSLMDYDARQAHESQWGMLTPCDKTNTVIVTKMDALIRAYNPYGICLTHARFKHPADINSLFDIGEASFKQNMLNANISVDELSDGVQVLCKKIKGMTNQELLKIAAELSLIELLDSLVESDLFSRWFAFRCAFIALAIEALFSPIRTLYPKTQLGTNAMNPLFSVMSGQHYETLSRHCDFIQPLLGYMRWHVLQSVFMWGRLFSENVTDLSSADALELSRKLFGISPGTLSNVDSDLDGTNEGDEADVIRTVELQLERCAGNAATMMPVLRGKGWQPSTITRLTESARLTGIGGVIYQGSDYVGGPPPGDGWS
jgi:hypothetical protein